MDVTWLESVIHTDQQRKAEIQETKDYPCTVDLLQSFVVRLSQHFTVTTALSCFYFQMTSLTALQHDNSTYQAFTKTEKYQDATVLNVIT